jgi:hypothetical protein
MTAKEGAGGEIVTEYGLNWVLISWKGNCNTCTKRRRKPRLKGVGVGTRSHWDDMIEQQSPVNLFLVGKKVHSGVDSPDPSDQGPFHSDSPQGVANDDKTLAFVFDSTKHWICMIPHEAVDCCGRITATSTIEIIIGTPKEAILVCEEKLLIPEFFGIKNVLYSD